MYTTSWQLRPDPRAGYAGFVYKNNLAAAGSVYKNVRQLRRSGRGMYTYEYKNTDPGPNRTAGRTE